MGRVSNVTHAASPYLLAAAPAGCGRTVVGIRLASPVTARDEIGVPSIAWRLAPFPKNVYDPASARVLLVDFNENGHRIL